MRDYSRDRKDANDSELAFIAKQLGAKVIYMRPGQGFDWLLVWRGQLYAVEIKNGRLPPSAQKLTVKEVAMRDELEARRVEYHVVRSRNDLYALLGIDNIH